MSSRAMRWMVGRVPNLTDRRLQAFCASIVPLGEPVLVRVHSRSDAALNECLASAEAQVRDAGGSVAFGWRLTEFVATYFEAEFHAVWRQPSGGLLDVGRPPAPFPRIAFLADPGLVYRGCQIDNHYAPLSSHSAVAELIAALHDRYEFINRGERAAMHGRIVVDGAEADEVVAIDDRIRVALSQLGRRPEIQRAPCLCGSGLALQSCCVSRSRPRS